MNNDDLLTISVFARACGLTASALRFYADSGVLAPAFVDDATGYRYYRPDQIDQGVLVRRLREMDMPLVRLREVLDAADVDTAVEVVDAHVAEFGTRLRVVAERAAEVRASLRAGPSPTSGPVELSGIRFATGLEQVLSATVVDPELPVLDAVGVSVSDDRVTLVATDRFRLATRTFVVLGEESPAWSQTVDADDLRSALPWLRRRHRLTLAMADGFVEMRADGEHRRCRTMDLDFPDHEQMLRSLPAATTRVLVSHADLCAVVERARSRHLHLRVGPVGVEISGDDDPGVDIAAEVSGPVIDIDFDVVTLHPAIAPAVGAEVILEFSGPEMPMIVRSADSGDLTTVAMPVRV
ncbi:MerR family transcriptional regulator [Gordonia sp. CPCC 206044]|uniref:DNA polymerase III subunit beta family protein n=1 Tax=Gordonia sp. CPCC 206044 TaxID=3140793 RepID=UPI003AF39ECC